jgi:hypothetical protein
MIDQKALETARRSLKWPFNKETCATLIEAYEAAKPQPDQEALDIVLDAAETIARLWSGTKAYDLKEAIAKLRGTT